MDENDQEYWLNYYNEDQDGQDESEEEKSDNSREIFDIVNDYKCGMTFSFENQYLFNNRMVAICTIGSM